MLLRRVFIRCLSIGAANAQYSSLDLIELQRRSQESEAKREAMEAAHQAALRLERQQKAYWSLLDAMCRYEPFVGNPHLTDARLEKRYRDALKSAINSLKD